MVTIIDSIPARPLTKSEILSMGDKAREYAVRDGEEEAVAFTMFSEEYINALGFDTEREVWVRFYQIDADTEFSEAAFQDLDDAIRGWVKSEYAAELDAGDVRFAGPDDPVVHDEEPETPPEVDAGLEPEFDCPECDFYETGVTTGPHAFLDHLRNVHDYSSSEAHEVLNG